MKKIKFTALGSIVSLAILLTSCGSGVSTTVSLKNDVDSLSYAYGATFYETQMSEQLREMGLVVDTAMIVMNYDRQIDAAENDADKAKLGKEKKQKLDSIKTLNERNISGFFRGFQEGMKATEAKRAYILGSAIGGQVAEQMIPGIVNHLHGPGSKASEKFSQPLFLSGMLTSMRGEKMAIDGYSLYVSSTMQGGNKEQQQAAAQAKILSEVFLAENKTKEGVVTLPSGLQYKVITEGKGAKPKATDVVNVHYHGTLIDGTVFDSSVARNEPIDFPVNQVIPGWTEILQLMPVGSKWQVYIPSDLAYGERGNPSIAPYSALIFDIELLAIQK